MTSHVRFCIYFTYFI